MRAGFEIDDPTRAIGSEEAPVDNDAAYFAIEHATRSALQAEYQARLFQTRAEIAAAVAGLALVWQQLDQARTDLPALERFAAASRRAADRGDLSLATAETAEQALRDRQTQIAQSERSIREQTIALELLTGAPRRMWSR